MRTTHEKQMPRMKKFLNNFLTSDIKLYLPPVALCHNRARYFNKGRKKNNKTLLFIHEGISFLGKFSHSRQNHGYLHRCHHSRQLVFIGSQKKQTQGRAALQTVYFTAGNSYRNHCRAASDPFLAFSAVIRNKVSTNNMRMPHQFSRNN